VVDDRRPLGLPVVDHLRKAHVLDLVHLAGGMHDHERSDTRTDPEADEDRDALFLGLLVLLDDLLVSCDVVTEVDVVLAGLDRGIDDLRPQEVVGTRAVHDQIRIPDGGKEGLPVENVDLPRGDLGALELLGELVGRLEVEVGDHDFVEHAPLDHVPGCETPLSAAPAQNDRSSLLRCHSTSLLPRAPRTSFPLLPASS
jgi:hypothetical protein